MGSGDSNDETVTALLRRWQRGDEDAAEELMPLVYDQMRRIAAAQMRGERGDHTLQPTAVVHEAYARMVKLDLPLRDRVHFMSMSARLMRRVLVDHARAHRAEKRGGGAIKVSVAEADAVVEPLHELLDLDAALERLGTHHERPCRVVELHYFGGMNYREIAEALGISEATIDRDMRFARAWLLRELSEER